MTIALVSDGFDPLHVGHVRLILEAGKLGPVCVLLNSNSWLIRKKGRFFMPFAERKEVLAGLKPVVAVLGFDDSDDTAVDGLKRAKAAFPRHPLTFCNGGDRPRDAVPELEHCERAGIGVLFGVGGGKIQSSSRLLDGWIAKTEAVA